MPATFNDLYVLVGTYEEVLDISFDKNVLWAEISWNAVQPTGSLIVCKTQLSLDGGQTWGDEKFATCGGEVVGIYTMMDLSNARLRVRFELSTSAPVDSDPKISDLRVSVWSTYERVSEWLSPAIDFTGITAGNSEIDWGVVYEPEGTSVTLFERWSYEQATWSSWRPVNQGIVISNMGFFKQYKAEFRNNPVEGETAALFPLSVEAHDLTTKGVWISPALDVSMAEDPYSVRVYVAFKTLSGASGAASVLTQSSPNGIDSWSQVYAILQDGTVQSPPNSFIRVYVIFPNGIEVTSVSVLLDSAATPTILYTGLTGWAEYDFTVLRDTLIIANGNDYTLKWDGIAEAASLLEGNPPVMSLIETHNNRVWGVERENPSRLRCSNALDAETWDAFNFWDFNPEDGDTITYIVRFGQNLIVSKRYSMALLVGSTLDTFGVAWLDGNSGVTGKKAAAIVDNKYFAYVSSDGIRITDFSTNTLLSDAIQPEWDNINHKALVKAAMVCWCNKLYIALAKDKSMANNVVWVYDLDNKAWSIYEGWEVSGWATFIQHGTDTLIAGRSDEGQVIHMLQTYYDDGVDVSYEWKSKEFNFNEPYRYKTFKNIYIEAEGINEENVLAVDMLVDGVLEGTYTTTVEVGEGAKHLKRILPPIYDAVLGRTLTLILRGKCTVHSITVEYDLKGAVPTEEL